MQCRRMRERTANADAVPSAATELAWLPASQTCISGPAPTSMQPHPSFQHLDSRSQPGNSSQDAPQAMTQHLQYVKAMQVK